MSDLVAYHGYFEKMAAALVAGDHQSKDHQSGQELAHDRFAHRIEAHRGNYRTSAASAIISGYPVVARLTGTEYMAALASRYVREHPPKLASLSLYGSGFAKFLREFAPVQKQLPWLSAVAELDAAWFAAYGAENTKTLKPDHLRDRSPAKLPTLAPGLVASASLLRFAVPAFSIWQTNKQDQNVKPVALNLGAEWAVIWRHDNQIRHRSISQGEYVFLRNIEAGQSLALAWSEAARFEKTLDLQTLFSSWLSAGIFAKASL